MARISISTPCEAKASDMSPTERGNFCKHCQKEVVDFTRMSDSEIIAFMKKQSGRTCGRLRIDQQNRPLIHAVPRKRRALFAGLLSLLSVGSPMVGQAASPKVEQTQVEQLPRLSLTFFDAETREPLYYVKISSESSEFVHTRNLGTHKEVYFLQGAPTKSIRLHIEASGYETQNIVLPPSAVDQVEPTKVFLRLAPLSIPLPYTLKGRVVSHKSGRPLRKAEVSIEGTGELVTTDIFGRFSLTITDPQILRHGKISINASHFEDRAFLIREMSPFQRVELYKWNWISQGVLSVGDGF